VNRHKPTAGNLGILCIVLFLVGCAASGSFSSAGEHLSVEAIEKDDPEKLYGEILMERIAEGDFKRRVIGWIDRAT